MNDKFICWYKFIIAIVFTNKKTKNYFSFYFNKFNFRCLCILRQYSLNVFLRNLYPNKSNKGLSCCSVPNFSPLLHALTTDCCVRQVLAISVCVQPLFNASLTSSLVCLNGFSLSFQIVFLSFRFVCFP